MTPPSAPREEALVSVIIPCHNAEAWLGETLDSVAIQRDVACEVIVVDDGSTDASARVAASVGGRHVRVIRQAQHGVAAARNTGTEVARGAFLQYLDADDILAAGAVRARLTALQIEWRRRRVQRLGALGAAGRQDLQGRSFHHSKARRPTGD